MTVHHKPHYVTVNERGPWLRQTNKLMIFFAVGLDDDFFDHDDDV